MFKSIETRELKNFIITKLITVLCQLKKLYGLDIEILKMKILKDASSILGFFVKLKPPIHG